MCFICLFDQYYFLLRININRPIYYVSIYAFKKHKEKGCYYKVTP